MRSRPWYLVATMCLMWVVGAMSAASGCANVSYLRGSLEVSEALDRALEQQSHPLVRASRVREQARLTALAQHHRTAFPLSLGQLLLGLALVFGSGAAFAGRSGWRELTAQIVVVTAALAVTTFVLLAPVRAAMAEAVAVEMVDRGDSLDPALGRDLSLAAHREGQRLAEVQKLLAQLSVYGLALFALTRKGTRAFFAAADADVRRPHERLE